MKISTTLIKTLIPYLFFPLAALAAPPNVTINQKAGQSDPTNGASIVFTVVFDQAINVATFTSSDVSTAGSTATGTLLAAVVQVAPNNGTTFEVTITGMTGSGTVSASIPAGVVQNSGAENNTVSTSTDNTVTFDNASPGVTIDKKIAQADPTNASPILFTVVFTEPIATPSFTNSDINLSASTTGGTLTPTITEVAPNNGTTFEVSVALTGSPVAGNVIASINAGLVQDLAGNSNTTSTSTDNIVAYQNDPPTVDSPSVTAITENSATLGGTISSDGGNAITERGTVWKASAGVTISDNKVAEGGTSTGTFSHSRTSLPNGSQIFYKAYAINSAGTSLSSEASFFTFSTVPDAQPASVSATAVSTTQINLAFSAASTIADAAGYVILRRIGADPDPSSVQDGVAPGSLALGASVLVADITNMSTASFNDTGLTPNTLYHYAVVPYNWNGINPETYNYRVSGGFTTDNDRTFSATSDIVLNGGTTADIDYAGFQASLITGTGNGEQLAQFQLRDGGASNDADNQETSLVTLTVSITNHTFLRRIALYDGGSVLAGTEQPVTGSSVTFTVPAGEIEASDNGSDDFLVLATFQSTVTDNAVIQLTITGATVTTNGSGIASSNAGGATTGGSTNRIEVDGTKVVFTPNTATVNASAPFSLQITSIDDLNNVDLDDNSSIDLVLSGGNPSAVLSTAPDNDTESLSNGTFTWSNLSINLAGTYTIEGEHPSFSGSDDAFATITIASLGVSVAGPANQNFCFGGAFTVLSPITLTETDPSDFSAGSNVTYSIILPTGFEFNTSATPTVAETSANPDNITGFGTTSYPAANIFRFAYSVTGTNQLDQITISNLQVRYTGTSAVNNQPIVRVGGSAGQAGNSESDGEIHGTIRASSGTPPIGFGFTVDEFPGNLSVDPNETNFNVNDSPVKLLGSESSGANSFSGNGVTFSTTQNSYIFTPSSVGQSSQTITYIYKESTGQQCELRFSKTFTIQSSIIQNLALEYCSNDNTSTSLNVPQADIDLRFGPGFTLVEFVFFDYATFTAIPNGNSFDPDNASYSFSLNYSVTNSFPQGRGVFIGYKVTNGSTTPIAWQFVKVKLAPTPSFFAIKTTFCADESAVQLFGTPINSNNTANDFFTNVAPVTYNAGTNQWFFNPSLAGASVSTQTFNITYTYRDPGTSCSNTTIAQTFTVNPRPGQVPGANITSGLNLSACKDGTSPVFTALSVSGTSYKWYSASPPTPGNQIGVPSNTFNPNNYFDNSVIGATNFFVTRTIDGCESVQAPLTISVTVNQPATAQAGNNTSICNGDIIDLRTFSPNPSVGGSASSATWSVLGGISGTFREDDDDPATLPYTLGNAVKYEPSLADINNGSITFILTTDDPAGPCLQVSDEVVVIVNSVASANAGTDIVVCSGDVIRLSGSISGAASSLTWSENGSGTLTSTITGITEYTPTSSELVNGATITFTLTTNDPPGPCGPDVDESTVTINKRPFVNAGSDITVCAGTPIMLAGTIPNNSPATTGNWSVLSPGLGIFTPTSGLNSQYFPSSNELTNGAELTLRLTSDDADGMGPCGTEFDDLKVAIFSIPPAPTIRQPDDYCVGDNILPIEAFGSGTIKWYNSLMSQVSTGSPFITGVQSNTSKQVDFFATQTTNVSLPAFAGCESSASMISIIVNPQPFPDFSFANICLGNSTEFADQSTIGGGGSIVSWGWNFDDATLRLEPNTGPITGNDLHGGLTNGSYNNLTHIFQQTGNYNVRLTAVSDKTCKNEVIKQVKIGPYPVADFSFRNLCEDETTEFSYKTTPGVIVRREWSFDDPASTSNAKIDVTVPPAIPESVTHKFSGVRTYTVNLKLTTDLGCEHDTTRQVFILPYIQDLYAESFETSTHGWASEGFIGSQTGATYNTSWRVETPSGGVSSAFDGSHFWISRDNTLSPVTYNNDERSVLYGPCVNIQNIPRPVLSFEYWNDTDLGDGVYVETSTDGGTTWQVLGNLNAGLNWYNKQNINGLFRQNGIGQLLNQFGWSGTTPGWTSAKFSLGDFASEDRVRFRFVFGSSQDNTDPTVVFDGFALDQFSIKSRNKTILIENFTNESTSNANANNSAFRAFNSVLTSDELAKIQYHTNVGGEDDINLVNEADPEARAAFYGITTPFAAYIDGYSGGAITGTWITNEFNARSLVTSPIEITITTPPSPSDLFNVEASIKALEDIAPAQYMVQIAIVESQVGSEDFVLRKLLPGAAGTPFTAITKDSEQVINVSYDLRHVEDPGSLSVIVFVQSVKTVDKNGRLFKNVLQAKVMDSGLTVPSNVITGVEVTDESFSAYPNPASDQLTITLPKPVSSDSEVVMVDNLGKMVSTSTVEKGQQRGVVTTHDLPAGVYLVKAKTPYGELARKVVVVHGQ